MTSEARPVQYRLDGEPYRCLLADPPWLERGAGRIKRGADRHYDLLPTRDIPRVLQASPLWRPADDAHLWLWVTNNFLPDGLHVLDALGFRYVTMLTWAKDQIGLGQYLRGQTEHLLLGVRGQAMVPPPERRRSTLLVAPRGRHSEKPTEAYAVIENCSPGPRAEFFARSRRPGWEAWGDQAPPPPSPLAGMFDVDDDCDGKGGGEPGAPTPTAPHGLDDDCDGKADEEPGTPAAAGPHGLDDDCGGDDGPVTTTDYYDPRRMPSRTCGAGMGRLPR